MRVDQQETSFEELHTIGRTEVGESIYTLEEVLKTFEANEESPMFQVLVKKTNEPKNMRTKVTLD